MSFLSSPRPTESDEGVERSLRGYVTGRPDASTEALAGDLMVRIRAAVPLLPVPLVAAALVRSGGSASLTDLEARLAELVDEARAKGANLHLAEGSVAGTLRFGAEALVKHAILQRDAETLRPVPGQDALLGYYAASVLQRLSEPAAETAVPTGVVTLPEVAET